MFNKLIPSYKLRGFTKVNFSILLRLFFRQIENSSSYEVVLMVLSITKSRHTGNLGFALFSE